MSCTSTVQMIQEPIDLAIYMMCLEWYWSYIIFFTSTNMTNDQYFFEMNSETWVQARFILVCNIWTFCKYSQNVYFLFNGPIRWPRNKGINIFQMTFCLDKHLRLSLSWKLHKTLAIICYMLYYDMQYFINSLDILSKKLNIVLTYELYIYIT